MSGRYRDPEKGAGTLMVKLGVKLYHYSSEGGDKISWSLEMTGLLEMIFPGSGEFLSFFTMIHASILKVSPVTGVYSLPPKARSRAYHHLLQEASPGPPVLAHLLPTAGQEHVLEPRGAAALRVGATVLQLRSWLRAPSQPLAALTVLGVYFRSWN